MDLVWGDGGLNQIVWLMMAASNVHQSARVNIHNHCLLMPQLSSSFEMKLFDFSPLYNN
jgi:hypothetical protein